MKKKLFLESGTLKKISKLFFSCLVFFLVLCSAEEKDKKFIKIFSPSKVSITAELAVTDEERTRGLMFREIIHPDQGMLFIFDKEGIHGFWMKNMRFSIDILWLDKKKRIIHIERHVPPCKKEPCPSYYPTIPAKYVLELKAGHVDENQLKLYDRLEFFLPPELR